MAHIYRNKSHNIVNKVHKAFPKKLNTIRKAHVYTVNRLWDESGSIDVGFLWVNN